jgi:hypothetical protein
MSDTPGRVRAVRGITDVKKFLKVGTMEELTALKEKLGKHRALLEKFGKPEEGSKSASQRRKGLPPKPKASGASFLRQLDMFVEGHGSRDGLVKEWGSVGAQLGGPSPFIGAVWDELPSEYKSTRAARRASSAGSLEGGGRSRTRKVAAKPVAGFAVVHSEEKPWVKEQNYRRWLAKLHRHTRKVKREGDEQHPANMCLDSDICKGDLGIPRRLMPQFTSPRDVSSFVAFAEKRYGIRSRRGTRKARQLRPSQEEINRERVEDVADDIRYKKLDPKVPLIVSRDGYVIDGHHRWAAYRVDRPKARMPVLVVDASARDVLSVAATWGAKHQQF